MGEDSIPIAFESLFIIVEWFIIDVTSPSKRPFGYVSICLQLQFSCRSSEKCVASLSPDPRLKLTIMNLSFGEIDRSVALLNSFAVQFQRFPKWDIWKQICYQGIFILLLLSKVFAIFYLKMYIFLSKFLSRMIKHIWIWAVTLERPSDDLEGEQRIRKRRLLPVKLKLNIFFLVKIT